MAPTYKHIDLMSDLVYQNDGCQAIDQTLGHRRRYRLKCQGTVAVVAANLKALVSAQAVAVAPAAVARPQQTFPVGWQCGRPPSMTLRHRNQA